MSNLKNKRILLIAARFFDYEVEITYKLSRLGAIVDYFDQRPSNSFLTKALIRINKKFLANTINEYYADLISRTRQSKYDFVLFISPEVITEKSFLELRRMHPDASFILYMWDSVRNKGKNIHDILKHFDHRFSFDKIDCGNPDWNIRYRPLFFLNDYAQVKDVVRKKYDLLFIGTIHSDRHGILLQLRELCRKHKLSYYYYMFFPSKLLFYLRRILDNSLRLASVSDFRFIALKKREIIDLIENSNVVVDIQHPKQTGLTMRTIEILGARRKLLTTNEDIVNYDFYHPSNIQLIDRNNVQVDMSFFDSPMVALDPAIYEKYAIDGWISDIFSLQKEEVSNPK